RLLDVTPETSLGRQGAFDEMLERLGKGVVFLFTLESGIAARALVPLAAGNKDLEKQLNEQVVPGITAFGLGLHLGSDGMRLSSHATFDEETQADMMALVSPDPPETQSLHRFVDDPDVASVVRLTFAPKDAEEVVLKFFEEKTVKKW